jgi:5-formyltetrahydrofolate cyclo-ligase
MLDYVLFPLVGFDAQGSRLGMGGGFYDRTFAQTTRWPKRPKLIGVAHDCQKVATLPLEPWDITLEAVVTDQGIYKTKN